MVDRSHGNSAKDHHRQRAVCEEIATQVEGGSHALFGVMMESHLVGGRQNLTPGRALGLRPEHHRPPPVLGRDTVPWLERRQGHSGAAPRRPRAEPRLLIPRPVAPRGRMAPAPRGPRLGARVALGGSLDEERIRGEVVVERSLTSAHRVLRFTVPRQHAPPACLAWRLDRYLHALLPTISRTPIQRWADDGAALVDGEARGRGANVRAAALCGVQGPAARARPGAGSRAAPGAHGQRPLDDGGEQAPGQLAHQAGKTMSGTLINSIQRPARGRGRGPRARAAGESHRPRHLGHRAGLARRGRARGHGAGRWRRARCARSTWRSSRARPRRRLATGASRRTLGAQYTIARGAPGRAVGAHRLRHRGAGPGRAPRAAAPAPAQRAAASQIRASTPPTTATRWSAIGCTAWPSPPRAAGAKLCTARSWPCRTRSRARSCVLRIDAAAARGACAAVGEPARRRSARTRSAEPPAALEASGSARRPLRGARAG